MIGDRNHYIWFRIHRRYNRYEVKAVTVGILNGFPDRTLKPSDGHVDFLIGEKRWSRVMVFRRANCMGRKDNSRPEYDRMERKNLGYSR